MISEGYFYTSNLDICVFDTTNYIKFQPNKKYYILACFGRIFDTKRKNQGYAFFLLFCLKITTFRVLTGFSFQQNTKKVEDYGIKWALFIVNFK